MFITNTILQNLINFLAPLVAIFMVVFCVMQGIQIAKGGANGSVKTLVTGILLFLFVIGLMYAAGSFETYGKLFQSLADTLINQTQENAGNIVG